jgi:hypothetical protein
VSDDKRDAARYRWLRNTGSERGALDWGVLGADYQDLDSLDAVIDASLQPQSESI